jgi:hypothetical protein
MMAAPEKRKPPAGTGGSVCTDLAVNAGENSEPITWSQVSWLASQGVPRDFLPALVNLRTVDGAIAFYEPISDDVVLWHPRTDGLTSMFGKAFALGEGNIANAGTYAFDCALHVHADALAWLRDKARGIVVLRWDLAFDHLRDAPRLAVAEGVLPRYQSAMRPSLPDLYVMREAA